MSKQSNPPLWDCPYCREQVAFGKSCPDDARVCERSAEKNVHWGRMMRREIVTDKPATDNAGIGISQISDEG